MLSPEIIFSATIGTFTGIVGGVISWLAMHTWCKPKLKISDSIAVYETPSHKAKVYEVKIENIGKTACFDLQLHGRLYIDNDTESKKYTKNDTQNVYDIQVGYRSIPVLQSKKSLMNPKNPQERSISGRRFELTIPDTSCKRLNRRLRPDNPIGFEDNPIGFEDIIAINGTSKRLHDLAIKHIKLSIFVISTHPHSGVRACEECIYQLKNGKGRFVEGIFDPTTCEINPIETKHLKRTSQSGMTTPVSRTRPHPVCERVNTWTTSKTMNQLCN